MLLSHLVNRGVRAELGGPHPTHAAADGGLPPNSPALQPEAPNGPLLWPPWPLLCPLHRRNNSRLSGASLSSSWRNCSAPALLRVEAGGAAGARGPENTFMWQGRELGLSASYPSRPPEWQRGGSPSPGPEWKFCWPDDSQMRLAPQALSHSLRQPAQDGCLGR